MLKRYAIAIGLGAAATFLIFFVMQALIDSGQSALGEETESYKVDFVRMPEQEEVREKERQPPSPPEQEPPPPQPDIPQQRIARDTSQSIDIGVGVDVDADLDIDTGISGGAGDGEYLPIVKVAPVYPYRAQSRGIEGWVLLEFTVTAGGAVEDVRVIEADPASIFDQAAIEAARKFKYKPRVVDGRAVAVTGVRNLIRFELQGRG